MSMTVRKSRSVPASIAGGAHAANACALASHLPQGDPNFQRRGANQHYRQCTSDFFQCHHTLFAQLQYMPTSLQSKPRNCRYPLVPSSCLDALHGMTDLILAKARRAIMAAVRCRRASSRRLWMRRATASSPHRTLASTQTQPRPLHAPLARSTAPTYLGVRPASTIILVGKSMISTFFPRVLVLETTRFIFLSSWVPLCWCEPEARRPLRSVICVLKHLQVVSQAPRKCRPDNRLLQ